MRDLRLLTFEAALEVLGPLMVVEEAGAGVTLVACECPDPVVLSLRLVPVITSSGSGNLSPVGGNGERRRLKEDKEGVKREMGKGNQGKKEWGLGGWARIAERRERSARAERKEAAEYKRKDLGSVVICTLVAFALPAFQVTHFSIII